jgi:hypothetical protein
VVLEDAQGILGLLNPPSRTLVRAAAEKIPLAGGAVLTQLGRVDRGRIDRGTRTLWDIAADLGGQEITVSSGRDIVSVTSRFGGTTGASRALDLRTDSFRDLPPGCAASDRRGSLWYLVCGESESSSIEALSPSGAVKKMAGSPGGGGHWVSVSLSPDGSRLLAQWSGECEVPQAYLVPAGGGKLFEAGGRPVESEALGWSLGGQAVVFFPFGACGDSLSRPGVYALSAGGLARRLFTVPADFSRVEVAFWSALR